jgi:hypothetical protein
MICVQDLREHRQQLSMSPVRSLSPPCVHPKQASATSQIEHSDSLLLQQLRSKAAQYARKVCACIIPSLHVSLCVCVCARASVCVFFQQLRTEAAQYALNVFTCTCMCAYMIHMCINYGGTAYTCIIHTYIICMASHIYLLLKCWGLQG